MSITYLGFGVCTRGIVQTDRADCFERFFDDYSSAYEFAKSVCKERNLSSVAIASHVKELGASFIFSKVYRYSKRRLLDYGSDHK